jgi:hypothetical protein
MYPLSIPPSFGTSSLLKLNKEISYLKEIFSVQSMKTVCSQIIKSWFHPNAKVKLPMLLQPVNITFMKKYWNYNLMESRLNIL